MDRLTRRVRSFACAAVVALGCGAEDASAGPSDGAPGDVADATTDGGSPWQACNGSRGMTLSCDSYRARPIAVSRFDRERGCYEAESTLEGLCAVPTYCPGGGGTVACVVDAEGDVYTALILWGEEVSSGWHHSDGADLGSTLTPADETLCREMASRTADADEQADAVILGSAISGLFELKPACSGAD